MIKSLLRRIGAALAFPLLIAAAPAQQPAQQTGQQSGQQTARPAAHPALWEVSDPDTTIYLFGTIHLLPDDFQWRSPKFDRAVNGSQELVIETIVDLQHPQSFQMALARMGMSPGLPPILDRVPPDKRALLQAAIAKSGVPESFYNGMETWRAAFQLLGLGFVEIGLDAHAGPEETLKQEFTAAHKPIGELETNVQQLGYFDALPEKAQRQLLLGAIDQPGNMKQEFGQMLSAWGSGDVSAIAKTFNHDLSDSPDLRQALIVRRNANWARWIEQRMGQPGTILIAVGAGHLAGRGSVIDLLQHAGYSVHRVQ